MTHTNVGVPKKMENDNEPFPEIMSDNTFVIQIVKYHLY